jgi:hypothetical protein
MSTVDTDIKLVDLRKENINTVREAIKIASSLGAADFLLYVNPNFVKNGLVVTKVAKLVTTDPPNTQEILNFVGLKNLKNTLDFAKKVLGATGEVTVPDEIEDAAPITAPAEKTDESAVEVPEAPKSKGRKKKQADPAEEEAEAEAEEAVGYDEETH